MANTPIPDDILDDVFNSNASGGGIYLDRYGRYTLLIEQSIYKQIKDVGRCFITKLQVLSAEKITVQEGATRDRKEPQTIEEEPHPIGYRCSYTINWDGKAKQSADGNAKALVLSIFGLNESKVDGGTFKATFRDLVSEKQPACGLVIQAEVRPKGVDKVDGVPGYYMRMPHWQCLGVPGQGENTWDKVQARRAETEKYIAAETAREADRSASSGGGGASLFAPPSNVSMPTNPVSVSGAPSIGAPSIPVAPVIPAGGPPTIAVDPLAGWQFHPDNKPGDPDPFYWKGSAFKRKSELMAGK